MVRRYGVKIAADRARIPGDFAGDALMALERGQAAQARAWLARWRHVKLRRRAKAGVARRLMR
jgi:hypothetical protein